MLVKLGFIYFSECMLSLVPHLEVVKHSDLALICHCEK